MLKLYVWEDVLTDYTSGVMFALAESVEEARAMLSQQHVIERDLKSEPKVITEPAAFAVWGGG
jgi:hypothetical protein